MKVPTATVERSSKQDPNAFQPSGPPTNSYYTPAAQLRGPPRLPLPIAENDHVPGSPLTGPLNDADDDISMFEDDESALPQREISMLSSTTVEEDEVADDAQPVAVDMAVPTKVVPTVITWKGTGEKVYVTGTFANWEKKFKLHRKCVNPCFLCLCILKAVRDPARSLCKRGAPHPRQSPPFSTIASAISLNLTKICVLRL